MNSFELIDFTNYDIKKQNKLIDYNYPNTDNDNENEYIIYQNVPINKYNSNIIQDMSYENIITINLDDIIKDIELSYTDIKEIQYQFILDINRSSMTYNGHIISDPIYLVHYLEYNYRKSNPSLEKELLMLSTQSIFAIPFCYIQNCVSDQQLYLSELSPTDPSCFKYNKKYLIDIINDHIYLEKYMRLFKLTESMDSKTEYIVKINIDINLKEDRLFLLNFYFIEY